MTYLAYCDTSKTLSQFDTAAPSALPYPIHNGQSNINSLALTADKEFALVWGPGGIEIRKTQGTATDTPVYTHKMWLAHVRVRNVAGAERIYFSARKSQSTGIFEIYFLKNNSPVLYATIDPKTLTFPNPCVAGEEIGFYSGDFCFGDDGTLYLSSGNVMGPNVGMKVGVYRVKNAGADTLAGSPERIYLGDGPIQGLCFVAPASLYFLRQTGVIRLDLASLKESPEGVIPISNPALFPRDLAYVKDGFLPTWWWKVIAVLIKLLTKTAEILRALAAPLAARKAPGPERR